MSDELEQLLRRADSDARIPDFAPAILAQQVRRTARKQRRLAACGLAVLALLACVPLLTSRHRESKLAQIPSHNLNDSPNLDALVHERTMEIFESIHHEPRPTAAPDAFLVELQMQRNRAALVLLRDAKRSDTQPLAAAALRRTIALFPETPAAASAGEELKHLDSSRSQL